MGEDKGGQGRTRKGKTWTREDKDKGGRRSRSKPSGAVQDKRAGAEDNKLICLRGGLGKRKTKSRQLKQSK